VVSLSEDYQQELEDDVFDRYNCEDIEDMTLQEFAEIVQYDYNNINFTFTLQICEPKWQECQEEKERQKQKDIDRFINKFKEKIKNILKKPSERNKVNQITKIGELLDIYKNPISAKELSKITGKPEPSVRRDLAKGTKEGFWQRIGKKGSRGVKYQRL